LEILDHAVPKKFDLSLFYKMADYCRPEEDNDVISCWNVEGFKIVYVLIFGDSSSRRSTNISPVANLQNGGMPPTGSGK
jgi:hypothetical protein